MANADLVAAVRSALQAASDPVRAAAAQQFLKSEMPWFGVRVPALRRTVKDAARQLPPGSLAELQETALRMPPGTTARGTLCGDRPVRGFVQHHGGRLSPLWRREALRKIR